MGLAEGLAREFFRKYETVISPCPFLVKANNSV